MKKLLIFSILTLVTTGCVSRKSFTKILNQKISESSAEQTNSKSDYLEFNWGNIPASDTSLKVNKVNSYFVPAIFYWEWQTRLKCNLNEVESARVFSNYFHHVADSVGLKRYLYGQRLEISIENIPHTFEYVDKGFVVFALVAYATGGVEAIYQENQPLTFSYKVIDGTKVAKSGTINIAAMDTKMRNGWNSTKKFTRTYIDRYDSNLKDLGKRAVQRMINEINTLVPPLPTELPLLNQN